MISNHRIHKLQARLQSEGFDGAVFATSASLQYLLDDSSFYWQRTMETGFYVLKDTPLYSTERSYFHCKPDILLWVPTEGNASVIATLERAKTITRTPVDAACHFVMLGEYLCDLIGAARKIGVGLSCFSAIKAMLEEKDESLDIVEIEAFAEDLRRIKEPKEIAALRQAAAFTDVCMEKIVPMLRPGVTQWQVECRLNELAIENGCEDVPFPPSCTFTKTGDPRCQGKIGLLPKDEPLTSGTAIAFDNGFVMNGYCSDYGRSFYCGKAPEHIANAYEALQTAQTALFDAIRPGIPLSFTYDHLYKTLSRFGYEKYLRNFAGIGMMGHQIGIDVHEEPWLHNNQEAVFQPGMVMCIEPKLWLPGEVFMRTEDMVLITENGCESLTVFDRGMFELPLD